MLDKVPPKDKRVIDYLNKIYGARGNAVKPKESELLEERAQAAINEGDINALNELVMKGYKVSEEDWQILKTYAKKKFLPKLYYQTCKALGEQPQKDVYDSMFYHWAAQGNISVVFFLQSLSGKGMGLAAEHQLLEIRAHKHFDQANKSEQLSSEEKEKLFRATFFQNSRNFVYFGETENSYNIIDLEDLKGLIEFFKECKDYVAVYFAKKVLNRTLELESLFFRGKNV